MKIVTVAVGRMGSERLRNKTTARIAGRESGEIHVRRMMRAPWPLVVATTVLDEDDAVDAIAQRCGVHCLRGSIDDVLLRTLDAADVEGADGIVFSEMDDVFVCPDLCIPIVDSLSNGADVAVMRDSRRDEQGHTCYGFVAPGLPCTGFSVAALDRAVREFRDADRRHLFTGFMSRQSAYRISTVPPPGYLKVPGFRLTLDTAADAAIMETLVERLKAANIDLIEATASQIVTCCLEQPSLVPLMREAGTAARTGMDGGSQHAWDCQQWWS